MHLFHPIKVHVFKINWNRNWRKKLHFCTAIIIYFQICRDFFYNKKVRILLFLALVKKKRICMFNKMSLPLIICNWILHCIYQANPSFGDHLKWLLHQWENANRTGKKRQKISYIRMICREYCVPINYTRGMYKMQLSWTSRLPWQRTSCV